MDFNICPIIPNITGETGSYISVAVAGIIYLLVVILVSLCIGKFASEKWKGNKQKTVLGFVLISSIVAVALFCFFGLSVKAIKGIIFTHILLTASYSDIKKRECDDYLSVMILVTAFIGIELNALPGMFVASLLTAGIFLFVVLTVSNGIGGADIKLASASTFLLGFSRGVIGLVVGLLLAIIVNSIKNKKSGFPMVPYLTAAFIPAFFL